MLQPEPLSHPEANANSSELGIGIDEDVKAQRQFLAAVRIQSSYRSHLARIKADPIVQHHIHTARQAWTSAVVEHAQSVKEAASATSVTVMPSSPPSPATVSRSVSNPKFMLSRSALEAPERENVPKPGRYSYPAVKQPVEVGTSRDASLTQQQIAALRIQSQFRGHQSRVQRHQAASSPPANVSSFSVAPSSALLVIVFVWLMLECFHS